MNHLGPLLTITLEGDYVPPALGRAVQAGYAGGVIMHPSSLNALGHLSWFFRDTARLGGQLAPLLYLEPDAGPDSLFPLPSLEAIALSGLATETRRLLLQVGSLIRQFGVDALLGPGLVTGSSPATLSAWSEQKVRYTQIWVKSLQDAHIIPFIRAHHTPAADRYPVPAVLSAAVGSGLAGIVLSGPSATGGRDWSEALQYSGVMMRDLRESSHPLEDLIPSLAGGFHTALLSADCSVEHAYAALRRAFYHHQIQPAHIRLSRDLAKSLRALVSEPPTEPEVKDNVLAEQLSQHIWNEAVIHTGPPLLQKRSAKIVLIEFGTASPLSGLLGKRMLRYILLPLDPNPGDMIAGMGGDSETVYVVHLVNAREHRHQISIALLCHPRPLAIAMEHPEDLLTLPSHITGLTNFDHQLGAYRAIAGALLGNLPVHRGWPEPLEVFPP